MKKLVYSALALTLTGLPALATDNGWSGLDKEIESLSSSLSTADGNAPKIGGWIRTSYRQSSDDFYTGGGGAPDQSGFQFDTVRINIEGDVSDNYGYKLSFDLGDGNGAGHGASPNGAVTLRDAYATWRIAEGIKGKIGRFKEPVLHSALTPEPWLLFLDRTGLGSAMSVRDMGLAISGAFDVLSWWVAFQDGADGQADDHKYTVRVTANLVGTAGDKLVEGAYGAGDNTVVTVGVAYQDDTFLDDGTVIAGEGSLNMGPFSLAAEIVDFDKGTTGVFGRTDIINDVSNSTPWDVTVSYAITPDWELAGRYEDTDDNDSTTSYSIGAAACTMSARTPMQIRVGYELVYDCPQPTPMVLMLNVHHSRAADLVVPDLLTTDAGVPVHGYFDMYGNWCSRILAPAGRIRITANGIVNDYGQPDPVVYGAQQHAVQDLPDEVVVFLLGSRYCETDHLSETAWRLFGHAPLGWGRVQAICDFVHNHITFDYLSARPTRTAWDVFHERRGVCRDYAHLAVALCRCMNIPARYCTGYVSDIGVPPPWSEMDFAGWFEAYLGGQWHTFDPRNNTPRIGRILMGRGRDAVDVPISNTFGANTLVSFKVWTDEVVMAG